MLPNDTVCSQEISTPSAHTFFFQFCRTISVNDENHDLGRPGRPIQKKLDHLCFASLPGKIKWCLASAQSKPFPQDQSLSGEAWHKVRSNLLKAALLDSGPVFPVML